MRGLYRRSQTGRGQPSIHVDGDVKLTKLLQKSGPHQPWFDENQSASTRIFSSARRSYNAGELLLKRGILAPSNAGRERYRTLSHRCKPKGGAAMHTPDALCAKESI
jgi:hypothetical protein